MSCSPTRPRPLSSTSSTSTLGTDSRNSSSLCCGGTRGRDRQRVRRSHATGPGGEKGKLLYDWLRSGGRWQVIRDFAVAHASDLVDPATVTVFDRICGSHPEWARSGCIGGSCIWRQRRKTGRPCFAPLTNWRLTQAACGPRSTRPTRRFLGVLALRSPGCKAASTTTSPRRTSYSPPSCSAGRIRARRSSARLDSLGWNTAGARHFAGTPSRGQGCPRRLRR
jgi:hypothetical protein